MPPLPTGLGRLPRWSASSPGTPGRRWSRAPRHPALGVAAAGAMGMLMPCRSGGARHRVGARPAVLDRDFGTGNANLILLVTARSGTVDDPRHDGRRQRRRRTRRRTGVRRRLVLLVPDRARWPPPRIRCCAATTGGTRVLVLAYVEGDATSTGSAGSETNCFRASPGDRRRRGPVAGAEAVSSQVSEQAAQDFVRAELLIVPLMSLLLIALYRRVRLALLTLGVGLFAVFGTLAGLRLLAGDHRGVHLRGQHHAGDGAGPRRRLQPVPDRPIPRGADRRRQRAPTP